MVGGVPAALLRRVTGLRPHGRPSTVKNSGEFTSPHLLPFKHENVRVSSACGVDGHRQGLAIGRKLDFLGVRDLAVELAGQFQCVLIQSAPVHPLSRQAGWGGVLGFFPTCHSPLALPPLPYLFASQGLTKICIFTNFGLDSGITVVVQWFSQKSAPRLRSGRFVFRGTISQIPGSSRNIVPLS
jgi:hypothetical protein